MVMRFIRFSFLLLLLCVAVIAQAQDTLFLNWPADQTSVTGDVSVRGTVNPSGLQSYFLETAPYNASSTTAPRWTPVTLPANTPVVNDILGTWSTAVYPDGLYQLRLRAVLTSGQNVYYTIAPIAVNNKGATLSSAPVTAIETPDPDILGAAPTATVTSALPTMTVAPVDDGRLPLGGHVAYFEQNAQDAMKQAGMTWVKFQLRFHIGDTIDAARDVIERGHKAGFKVLLGIVGDRKELTNNKFSEYNPIFAEFLGQVATLNPDAIEVWNEMNIDREWPTGRIDPSRYADMLRLAYTAIKDVNPDIMVITGALAPTGAEGAFGLGAVWNDDRYYQGMARTDIPQYADCIGAHYNEGVIPPDWTSGDPRDGYPTRYLPRMLERVSRAFQGFDIPMCFTELGYLTPEGYSRLPGGFAWASNVSIAEQAEWLTSAYRILEAYEPMPVKIMIIWNVDFTQYDADPMAGYAIIRADKTCPACEALAER
jgi:hypothetical protein